MKSLIINLSLTSLAPLQVWYGRRACKLLAIWLACWLVKVKLQL